MERPVVVAGNGRSIMDLKPGRILASDFIIRTNNFFFEPRFFLGQRVDLAFMAGDPRVAPFMFETLYQCRNDYDLRGWTSHNERVIKAGRRRFGALFQPVVFRDKHIEAEVNTLIARYQKPPTTGVYAVLMAHGLGAQEIILAGIDFYSGSRRYPFEPGRHYSDLLGHDLSERGFDTHLHDAELDRSILGALRARGDTTLFSATETAALADITSPAPVRQGPNIEKPRASAPVDWEARSGLYPIHLLKFLRRASASIKRHRKGI